MINQFDPKHRPMLENLQGNILKGHGRGYTRNIFFKVIEVVDKPDIQKELQTLFKEWLNQISGSNTGVLVSAKKQIEQGILFKKKKVDGGTFACLHLTYTGYCQLIGKEKVDKKIADSKFNENFPAFTRGMKEADLGDSKPEKWEAGLSDTVDGMLILADDDIERLETICLDVQKQLSEFAAITTIEEGSKLENEQGAGIEHFGYVDGISQPLFFEDEMDTFLVNHGLKNQNQLKYNPAANVDLVLLDDPFIDAKEALGSFFVFRKLEQNVRDFKKAEKALGFALGLKGDDGERAGALIVGRFEDGTPVEVSETEGIIRKDTFNNFDFDVEDASRCPYHAHIRKTNPRSDIEDAQSHMMARRGIPFGTRKDDPSDGIIENKPEGGVGLLFMSYQANISNQFEIIQREWANEPDFIKKDTGIDLIIGNGNFPSTSQYPTKWGKAGSSSASFGQFVTLKGGEYFFTPSLPFLRTIK